MRRGVGRGLLWALWALWARGSGDQDDQPGRSSSGGADSRALEVAVDAGKIHGGERALEALEWLE